MRAAGASDHEFHGKDRVPRFAALALLFQSRERTFRSTLTHVFNGLANDANRRLVKIGHFEVVEANDRQGGRNSVPLWTRVRLSGLFVPLDS